MNSVNNDSGFEVPDFDPELEEQFENGDSLSRSTALTINGMQQLNIEKEQIDVSELQEAIDDEHAHTDRSK